MSDTTASLVRKIASAKDLHSVVRTMKAIAASRIAQYENSVLALGDYYKSVELALAVYFREDRHALLEPASAGVADVAVVFGSDQGMVGQFNQVIAQYTAQALTTFPEPPEVWAVGERVHASLLEAGVKVAGQFLVPTSVKGIVPLVRRIQIETGEERTSRAQPGLIVYYNRPQPGGLYAPVSKRLLPLDVNWKQQFASIDWPNRSLPKMMPTGTDTLRALISEYLFISIFRACAESLASENASRLAAMTRAERNINELSDSLLATFHRLRQDRIDEELFDVIAGYEARASEVHAR